MIGIDISYAQGAVDWATLRADFVIARAGGYGSIVDDQFSANRAGANAHQVPHGFYYFAGGGDPAQEADHFRSIVGDLLPGEFIALDWETDHADPVGWCLAFLQRAESVFGVTPSQAPIYLNLSTINAYDWSPIANRGNPLWAAGYWNDMSPNHSFATGAWPAYMLWQYSDCGRFPGIGNDVDVNIGSIPTATKEEETVNIGRFQPDLYPQSDGSIVARCWYDDFPGEDENRVNSWINLLLGKAVHVEVDMTGTDKWLKDTAPDTPETHLHFDKHFPDRDRRGNFKIVLSPLDGVALIPGVDAVIEYDWMH